MVSGAHWHGKRKTDAGWLTHGTKSSRHEFDQQGFMHRWEHKPRAHRALWRWACFFAFCGLVFGLIAATPVTLNALGAMVVYGLAVALFIVENKVRLRVHERTLVKPIVKSIAPLLRLSPHAVRRMLHLSPENIRDEGEVGYFEFPPELTPSVDTMSSMERVIDAHMPVDIEFVAQFAQTPKLGVIKAGLKPPPMVLWDETVTAMQEAAAGDIIIGKDRHKQIFKANFIDMDDPHWAFCVQSKRGKSNFLGLVAVQVLHQDPMARVAAIDPKRSSLVDFLGSPDYVEGVANGLKPLLKGVTMANDPTNGHAMWDVVTGVKKLFDDRSEQFAKDRSKKFPVCLLLVDELNMLRAIIRSMWNGILEENAQRPKEDRAILGKECPIWEDIHTLLQAGRFVGIHVMAVAQDFRDDAIGGHGGRNYFGLRALGGFHPNQWKYFVGTTPVPEAQLGVGRWIFTQGEQKDWVQITHCDPDKAYKWASVNRELFREDDCTESVPLTDHSLSSAVLESTATDGHTIEPVPVRVVVGYREAAKLLGYNRWDSFRRARERWMDANPGTAGLPGEYRQGRSPAWPEESLTEWAASLPRRGK